MAEPQPSPCALPAHRVKRLRRGSEEGRAGMPKRSSQDRAEGAADKAKGRVKEAGGSLAGDKGKKAEGRADQRKGEAKKKSGAAKDLAQ